MDPVPLTTSRLSLSVPEAGDEPAIAEACRDEAIQRFTTVPSPYTADDAHAFVAEYCPRGWSAGTDLVWGARHDGALVAMAGLHHVADGSAELGYWAVPAARGRGYMREVGERVLAFAFADAAAGLGCARVAWRAFAGNAASAGVARSLGFRYRGTGRREALRLGERHDVHHADLLADDDRRPVAWPADVAPVR